MAYSGAERLISPVGLLVPLDTDSLAEGANNLYFDTARVDSVIAGNSTVAGLASDISSNTVGIAATLALNQAVQQANADAIAATDLLRLENTVQAAVNETAIAATAADLITTNNSVTTLDATVVANKAAADALLTYFPANASNKLLMVSEVSVPSGGQCDFNTTTVALPAAVHGARMCLYNGRILDITASTVTEILISQGGQLFRLDQTGTGGGFSKQILLAGSPTSTSFFILPPSIDSTVDLTLEIYLVGYWK